MELTSHKLANLLLAHDDMPIFLSDYMSIEGLIVAEPNIYINENHILISDIEYDNDTFLLALAQEEAE